MKQGLLTLAMFFIGLIAFLTVFAVYAVLNIIVIALMGGIDGASEKPGWMFIPFILIDLTVFFMALYVGTSAAKKVRHVVTRG